MAKRLVMLGAGVCQVLGIRKAQDQGLEVVAVGDSLEEAEQIVERAVAEIRIEVM